MTWWSVDFGKVRYVGKAPKGAPRWVWRCSCDKCSALPPDEGLHGPFKTKRDAERDAEQFFELMSCEPDSMGTA
jgi:hypothetical protein